MAAWFETVADAQRRARKRLPPSVYSALVAGSEKGVTVSDNTAAFAELRGAIWDQLGREVTRAMEMQS